MEFEAVRGIVQEAINLLKNTEVPPLEFSRVSERSIAHRLALHLEGLIKGWNVDCEYDRDGIIQKVLEGVRGCDTEKKTDQVIPDIIVHHRKNEGPKNNLLVIEMKKASNFDACDDTKLRLFTDSSGRFGYQYGLFINVAGGDFRLSWYVEGRKIDE